MAKNVELKLTIDISLLKNAIRDITSDLSDVKLVLVSTEAAQQNVLQLDDKTQGLDLTYVNLAATIAIVKDVFNAITGIIRTLTGYVSDQEQATLQLTQALSNIGIESLSTYNSLHELSNELQALSRYSNLAILRGMALYINMAGNANQIDRVSKSAMVLAKVYGFNLLTAYRYLAQAQLGNIMMLSRWGIKVDLNLSKSLQYIQVLDQLLSKFGALLADLDTIEGAALRMTNAFDDLMKALLQAFSPTVTRYINLITVAIQKLINTIEFLNIDLLNTKKLIELMSLLDVPKEILKILNLIEKLENASALLVAVLWVWLVIKDGWETVKFTFLNLWNILTETIDTIIWLISLLGKLPLIGNTITKLWEKFVLIIKLQAGINKQLDKQNKLLSIALKKYRDNRISLSKYVEQIKNWSISNINVSDSIQLILSRLLSLQQLTRPLLISIDMLRFRKLTTLEYTRIIDSMRNQILLGLNILLVAHLIAVRDIELSTTRIDENLERIQLIKLIDTSKLSAKELTDLLNEILTIRKLQKTLGDTIDEVFNTVELIEALRDRIFKSVLTYDQIEKDFILQLKQISMLLELLLLKLFKLQTLFIRKFNILLLLLLKLQALERLKILLLLIKEKARKLGISNLDMLKIQQYIENKRTDIIKDANNKIIQDEVIANNTRLQNTINFYLRGILLGFESYLSLKDAYKEYIDYIILNQSWLIEAGLMTWLLYLLIVKLYLDRIEQALLKAHLLRIEKWRETEVFMGITMGLIVDFTVDSMDKAFSTIGDAFGQMAAHGKSFRHVMKNIWKDILSSFISMVTQMTMRWLAFKALTSMFPGSPFVAALFPTMGMASGGYTGDISLSSVAGVVHGKEYVFSAPATKGNVGFLDWLHKLLMGSFTPSFNMPAYATGGYVSPGGIDTEMKMLLRLLVEKDTYIVLQGDVNHVRFKRLMDLSNNIYNEKIR